MVVIFDVSLGIQWTARSVNDEITWFSAIRWKRFKRYELIMDSLKNDGEIRPCNFDTDFVCQVAHMVHLCVLHYGNYDHVHLHFFENSFGLCQEIYCRPIDIPWSRHQMETFSTLLAICAGNSPVTDEFPAQRPVTRSFDVLFDQRLNQRLSKQSWGWLFETLSRPLWRHCNIKFPVMWFSLGSIWRTNNKSNKFPLY